MNAEEAVKKIIEYLGGKDNIVTVTNCMTRLRVVVKKDDPVQMQALQELPEVLGLVHDRDLSYEVVVGPGKSRKYADICHAAGLPAAAEMAAAFVSSSEVLENAAPAPGPSASAVVSGENAGDWKTNKEKLKRSRKENKLISLLKVVGDIFVPLIPGVIVSGLCAGFASLISQLIPDYAAIPAWNIIYTLLTLVKVSFMTYITAWAGYRAAERFGATPVLGGMLGMITSLQEIDTIARTIGLYDEQNPLSSILRSGKGGVLAVIIGVWLLSVVEKKIRKHMPDSVDIIFTPLLSLLAVMIPYIVIVMPLFGYISSGISWVFGKACMSGNVLVRVLTGYVASAAFLPLVAAGMHHGLVALYSVQLQEIGYITLYPALAMAGAGQVGAALAILMKAKKTGNTRLTSVIRGALPAGVLGVGEPLIYGVTLPMGKPFLLAGLGAGFGGAFTMLMQVASTTWGPSGLLGIFVMTAGPRGAIAGICNYLIGLVISYVMSFLITNFFLSEADVAPEKPAGEASLKENPKENMREDPAENPAEVSANSTVNAEAAKSVLQSKNSMENTTMEKNYRRVSHGERVELNGADAQTCGDTSGAVSALNDGPAMNGAGAQNDGSAMNGAGAQIGGPAEFRHIIADAVGMHARPAAAIVETVKKYDCRFTIEANGKTADGKSVIQIMSLGATQGTELFCHAEGPAAAEAIDAVRKYMEKSL